MNFTSDIKKEIIARGIEGGAEVKAALSAFVRTSGSLGVREGRPAFFIVSETENVAEFFTALFGKAFGTELSVARASMDRMSGRDKLVLESPEGTDERILGELGLLRRDGKEFSRTIPKRFTADEKSRVAYIKGAFLGGGSCTLPAGGGKTGYHLEFVFPEMRIAEDFCRLLSEAELIAKVVERKEAAVAYIKSKETISDFLAVVGAEAALKKFSEVVEKRDESNRSNRAANCFSGNADKSATASVKQVMAIRRLSEGKEWEALGTELKETAEARLENPFLSLQELADVLGISKSCLNHRMRRLVEAAEKVER